MRIILCWFIFITSLPLFSQKENTQWYFGNGAALNFLTNPPTIIGNSSMVFGPNEPELLEGTASISDAAGSLIFYTNGRTVWNNTGQVMANGTGLISKCQRARQPLL